jgi:hypothetical protein
MMNDRGREGGWDGRRMGVEKEGRGKEEPRSDDNQPDDVRVVV